MSKIGLIAFAAAIALTGVSYAGEQVTLACSGTAWIKGNSRGDATGLSVVIDLDRGVVAWSGFGDFPITKNTDNSVGFKSGGTNGITTEGSVDRYSGHAVILSLRGNDVVSSFSLDCKPAKPLF